MTIVMAIGGKAGVVISDLLAIAAIHVVSALVHHVFEKPIMNLRPSQRVSERG